MSDIAPSEVRPVAQEDQGTLKKETPNPPERKPGFLGAIRWLQERLRGTRTAGEKLAEADRALTVIAQKIDTSVGEATTQGTERVYADTDNRENVVSGKDSKAGQPVSNEYETTKLMFYRTDRDIAVQFSRRFGNVVLRAGHEIGAIQGESIRTQSINVTIEGEGDPELFRQFRAAVYKELGDQKAEGKQPNLKTVCEAVGQRMKASIEEEKNRKLTEGTEALRKEYPDNPLFKNKIEAPEGYVSVYHFTTEEALTTIAENGLLPGRTKEKLAADGIDKTTKAIEEVFDKVVEELGIEISRGTSVFAYPTIPESDDIPMPRGRIGLEIKVDPTKVYVVDAELYTEAHESLRHGDDVRAEEFVEEYWGSRMLLYDYLKLPEARRLQRFTFPEVIVPNGIDPNYPEGVSPQYIRIATVLPDRKPQ